ncbi:MAG: 3TM-type holin [Burkholderiaceae bacterium]
MPDAAQKDAAKLELLKMQQSGELDLVKTQLSAVLSESQSADPWTSRARPSFMYVIYILILMGIPMGFVSAWKPEVAAAVAHGLQAWLAAIPDSLYTLFGVGYLGYTGARSIEKIKGSA